MFRRQLRKDSEDAQLDRDFDTVMAEHQRVMARADIALAESNRVMREAKISLAAMRTQRCFISYRFGDEATESSVDTLRQFLELVPVDVYTGKGFEPRSLSEKVLERIANSDILAVVLTSAGQSEWIRDELSTAAAKGKYIVILLEEGQQFEPGIHGDVEYVPFAKGHIEQTFIPLMEAVRYIRGQWADAERMRLDAEDAEASTDEGRDSS